MLVEPEIETAAAAAVWGLIEKAVASKAQEVDPRFLKAIKSTVRASDAEARAAVEALMSEMGKPSSQVRYLAVLIIDELFMRSKLFRSLLVIKLDEFLSLSVGFRRNQPLPPPSSIASTLRSKSIELLEKWNNSFGIHYRQLRLGFEYLKNTLKYQFPNRLENESRLQQERREREIRSKEILLKKFGNLKESYSSIKAEVRETINEIEECLDVLRDKGDEFTPNVHPENEVEEYRSLLLREIRLESLKEGEKIHENSDNKALFDALRELHKVLASKHLPCVKDWISVLLRVDLDDNRFRDAALKEFIDLSNHIQSVKKKCNQLSLSLDEEELWEEGAIEINENSRVEEEPVVPPIIDKGKRVADDIGSDSERSKLLAEAPVMSWGTFLDNWGPSRDVLANQRGLELEGHWGRVDNEAVIPAEKIAELNFHRTVYKEEAAEVRPCLAPLKKGGLCQRKDLKVCPFHGPITPRDHEGNPMAEKVSSEVEIPRDSAEEMVERLMKQAVKNVRGGDREVKLLKRAKIREHNEVVLRESALASTSYSESSAYETADPKGKKASRLRKKGSAKERLEQRLLSTRVNRGLLHEC